MKKILTTPFGLKVNRCADLMLELRRLRENRRLSPRAFVDEAMALAGIDAKRLDAVDAILEEHPNAQAAPAFVRRMMVLFREPNFPSPPRDSLKMTRAYGRTDTLPELTELKITAAEAIAVAAKRCAAKWPENFGPVEDLDAHHRRMTNVKAALDKSMDELRETWTQKDLTLCEDDLTQTERDRGLTRVVFRLAPHLRPGQPDWPPLLVAHVLQTSIGKRASRKVEKAKVVRRSTALAASV